MVESLPADLTTTTVEDFRSLSKTERDRDKEMHLIKPLSFSIAGHIYGFSCSYFGRDGMHE